MQAVTLAQVLEDREKRVMLQQTLIRAHGCPLISFTMNIAGPIKTSPLIERAFRAGLHFISDVIPATSILHTETSISVTGCQAMFCVDLPAERIKQYCIKIEEATPLGRLFDMDVIDVDGKKLSRTGTSSDNRGCIVCGAPGRACAAGRLHSVEELQSATRRIMTDYFWLKDAEKMADLAVQSLIDEVHTTPKPGLVDLRNCGSHHDMDVSTFLSSAHSLRPYFRECLEIGRNTAQFLPKDTFPALRQAGIRAEETMYTATGGINTHKGIIYTMGILCGALGRMWKAELSIPSDFNQLLLLCGEMVAASVADDFSSHGDIPSTAGLRLFSEQGLTGIRGEVATGLPSVGTLALPTYRKALSDGLSPNDAGVVTLLHLIAQVKDTNLYHRGGTKGARFAAQAAKELLIKANGYPSPETIQALDDAFIERNLSPGGCADLLAVTLFLSILEGVFRH